MSQLHSIKAIAEKTGKTARALRYYEEMGLLVPHSRTCAGYRLYGDDAILQLEWIDKLQHIGFSLTEIQDFVQSLRQIETPATMMKELGELYKQKLSAIQEKIVQLQRLETELKASVEYTALCNPCADNHDLSKCHNCTEHGHKNIAMPELISVLTESVIKTQA